MSNSRVAFGEKTKTANHVALAVGGQGGKRVGHEHFTDVFPLALGLGVTLRVDPFLALLERVVGLGSGVVLAW